MTKLQNMMDIKRDLFQSLIFYLKKKFSGDGIKSEVMRNKGLAEELHEPIWKTKSTLPF